jgi:hypothetical protein
VAVTPGDQTFTHPNTEAGIQKLIHRSWPRAKHKVTLVACMRKLLTILNALFKK